MSRLRLGIVLLLALSACAAPEDAGNPSVALLTHNLTSEDGVPAAAIEAVLVTDAGCLVLQTDSSTLLAVWPPGSSRTADGVATAAAEVSFGDRATFGGGEVPPDAPAFADTRIPDACVYDAIWLISDVIAG